MDLRELQQQYLAQLRKVTAEKLVRGSLVRTVISEEEGLNLTDGRREKPKLMVIVGCDTARTTFYGSVLVNTNMNPRAAYSTEYLSAQYMLKQQDYPEFLAYDSYADCGVLMAIPVEKLLNGEYYGELNETDMQGVFDILQTTDTISSKLKRRYGLI